MEGFGAKLPTIPVTHLNQHNIPSGQHIFGGMTLSESFLQLTLVLLNVTFSLHHQSQFLSHVPRLHLDVAQNLLVQPDILENLLLSHLVQCVLVHGDCGAGNERFRTDEALEGGKRTRPNWW